MHMGTNTKFMVVRKGRKRKSGYRNSRGDLVRDKQPDDRLKAALQPHRRDLPEKLRLSEKATTVIGRLNLFGRITDEHYEAARLYAQGVNAYRAILGSFDPLMAAAPGFGGELTPEEVERRKEAYNNAFEALSSIGNKPIRAVNKAAVYDDPCYGMLSDLICGLDRLVRLYGLTAGRKSVRTGNRDSKIRAI